MFTQLVEKDVDRGNFFRLFNNKERFMRYIYCVLVGIPTWFSIGVLVTFSQSFAENMGVIGTVESGIAIMFAYSGITLGDFSSGFLSQLLRSRRKALLTFLLITAVGFLLYFSSHGRTAMQFYFIIGFLGFGTGFWAIVVTNAAEQFGTNLRATVATTVPNFIRGSLPLLMLLYKGLQIYFTQWQSAVAVAIICIIIPLWALQHTKETFGKDLDYIE
jgi:MFS family permease